MGARTGPNHGPIRAFSAIFACTGPKDGPVRALKGGMIFAKNSHRIHPGTHMKRTIILYLLSIFTLTLMQVSCGRHRLVVRGFIDEPQDSILIDLSEYLHPASKIELFDVRKCNGYYYFRFDRGYRDDYDGPCSILMAASENGLKAKHIPLPDGVDGVRQIFERNDTLMMESDDVRFYSFDPKKWTWSPTTTRKEDRGGTSYEDDDWMVRYADHGEFGFVSWFIDKHSPEEYAFVELNGGIRRISNTFYVVTPTRIYEIPDPTIGFHCDSATRYEKAQEAQLIDYHFYNAGYKPLEHFVNPAVRFDDWNISGEDYILEDGFRFVNNPYLTPDEIMKADTVIVNSFCASDTLFCVLNTPSGLELAKLDDAQLVPVHLFHKSIGSNFHHRFSFPYDYPSLHTRYKYRDKSNPTDERLLLLINTEAGVSELIDLAHNGNTLLKICYFLI